VPAVTGNSSAGSTATAPPPATQQQPPSQSPALASNGGFALRVYRRNVIASSSFVKSTFINDISVWTISNGKKTISPLKGIASFLETPGFHQTKIFLPH
jgi:hypothetical protein